MLNIRFKGKYEGEKQLIENSKLYKNATMFEEEETIKEAFKSGIKFVIPISIIMIITTIILIKINNIKLSYSIPNLFITSLLTLPLTYIHEIIHALTYPLKEKKDIYI